MIIVLFGGGLGNQMFQYAFARSLSILNNQLFKIDNSRYLPLKPDTYKDWRIFGLNNFNIAGETAKKEEIDQYDKYYKPKNWSQKLFLKIYDIRFSSKNYYKKAYIVEPDDHCQIFDPNILNYRYKDAYFRGFWQSENYFKDIREVLLQDFTVKTDPNEYRSALLKEIEKNNSISLHFRRGNNTDPKNPFGTLSFDYYDKAIKFLTDKIKNPNFYIFSDDIAWVKKNFKIDFPSVFIQNTFGEDYEDMRLMSRCKHHIIANSTFSWWGAWLATNLQKIVIAPERYAQKTDRPNPDYYPKSWILIKNK